MARVSDNYHLFMTHMFYFLLKRFKIEKNEKKLMNEKTLKNDNGKTHSNCFFQSDMCFFPTLGTTPSTSVESRHYWT